MAVSHEAAGKAAAAAAAGTISAHSTADTSKPEFLNNRLDDIGK